MMGSKTYDNLSKVIVIVAMGIVILPMIIYRENYIFTVHDYLDLYPPIYEMLRNSGLYFALDSSMPIMGGMSTVYMYMDYGINRFLDYFFGFIWGEIFNKAIAVIFGYYFTKRLLIYLYHDKADNNMFTIRLLAVAYAITPVYPIWSVGFGVLPFIIETFLRLWKNDKKVNGTWIGLYLTFGFWTFFPVLGIYMFGWWFIGTVFNVLKHKKVNIKMLVVLIEMGISAVVCNINLVIYVLRGDELNRSYFALKPMENITFLENLFEFIKKGVQVALVGQYHAAPILIILMPMCMILFFLFLQKCKKEKEYNKIYPACMIIVIICTLCVIYAIDAGQWFHTMLYNVVPLLGGFNFGRLVYLNNILWYILSALLLKEFKDYKHYNKLVLLTLCLHLTVIICSDGNYQDTIKNLNREKYLAKGEVTYKEFYDEVYFEDLKQDIDYGGEGVISVGIHPAVAIHNGYNTLDAYIPVYPINYNDKFCKMIKPTFKKYPSVEEYVGYGGRRLYVYIDDSKDVSPRRNQSFESRELLIDTESFTNMGGKYIFSYYELSNSKELGLVELEHSAIEDSIYDLYVYMISE